MKVKTLKKKMRKHVILEADNIGMMELAEVPDVRFFLVLDALDGHDFIPETTLVDGPLSSRAKPFHLS